MKLPARLLLSAASAAATALVLEGVASAFFGVSLLRRRPALDLPRLTMLTSERIATALTTAGNFALDPDPWVGMRMKSGFTAKFMDKAATTDELGQRKRTGPPPAPRAQRIVLLGDSVAFGVGVEDHETIGQRLEDYLASTIDPKEPRPIVQTVACPGWSFDNERRFLFDYFDRFAPDIVVVLPVYNDLDDSYGVYENGFRATTSDPARGARHPHTSVSENFLLAATRATRFPSARSASEYRFALYTGVTPESVRRFRAFSEGLEQIAARLSPTNGHLMVGFYSEQIFMTRLLHFLDWNNSHFRVEWLLKSMDAGDMLVGDPHPNAQCAAELGWRIARALKTNGWVRGATSSLPPEDVRYVGNEVAPRTPDELRAERTKVDELARADLDPEVNFNNGNGWHQIYGGVAPDGTVGLVFSAVLPNRTAKRLILQVDRIETRPDLYPLNLDIEVNGANAGRTVVPAPRAGEGARALVTVDLPPDAAGAPFLEVTINSNDWCVETALGEQRVASYRIVTLSFEK